MSIHNNFSVYEIIEKQHPDNIFLSRVKHMRLFSHVIEHDIINHNLNQSLYVGMQLYSNLTPILERYTKIAEITNDTYVFGVEDKLVDVQSGLHLLPICQNAKLAQEWFLIIDHPDCSEILSAREIASDSGERTFEAILTTDKVTVNKVSNMIAEQLSVRELAS